MRYVLDCSVAIKWFVAEQDSEIAERCLIRQQSGEIVLTAPEILIAEVGHTLRTHATRKIITATEGYTALAELLSMDIDLVPTSALATSAFPLALDHSGTFYDALYLALAQREDLQVLTADDRMSRAFAPLSRTLALKDLPT